MYMYKAKLKIVLNEMKNDFQKGTSSTDCKLTVSQLIETLLRD